MSEKFTEADDRLIRLIACGSKNLRWKHVRGMRNKIDTVVDGLRTMRKSLPDQHWLKTDLLTYETILRMALVDADLAGLRETPADE